MPINQFSSGVPEPVRWRQQPPLMEPTQKKHQPLWGNSQFYDNRATDDPAAPSMFSGQNASFLSFNRTRDDNNDEVLAGERDNRPAQGQFREQLEPEKEPMFEKPLTPSDVGKLNRLVIPKQHAEKYFPLGGGDSVDKGLLLSFEDESGKCWKFRYSYWNSSQSYVLTKGWSRFVKEKRLDAGDVVLFERHRVDGDRFFICHRRRSAAVITTGREIRAAQPAAAAVIGGSGRGSGWSQVFYSAHSYPSHPWRLRQPESLHGDRGTISQSQIPPVGSSKRSVRLFGVDLECDPDESEPSTSDGSSMSSQGQAQHHRLHGTNSRSSSHQSHMEINFSGDVNQMMKSHPRG